VFKLSLGGEDRLAMVKDVTTDPVTQKLLHIDLYRVFEDRQLEVQVPLHTHARAAGVVQGGVLNVTRRTVPVRTTPAKIPVSIDVDVTPLALKDSIAVEDIELPEGVVCTLSPKLTLAIVLEPRKVAPLPGEEGSEVAAEAGGGAAEGEAAKKAGD